jgi:DNA-binding FadR family transcriptional regulator
MPCHVLDDNDDREGFFLIGKYLGSWDYQLALPLIQFWLTLKFCFFYSLSMPPLKIVEPQRLYRQIAGQLRTLINQGKFMTGSRLPSERDLAKQLEVSRPSVREALIAMEVEGWIEVRTGSGIYVLDRSHRAEVAQVSSSEWGPLELIRARRLVEGEVAAIAAEQAKRKDVAAMRRAIDAMMTDAGRGVLPLEGDRAFHTAIVEACDNMVLIETVLNFWDSRSGPLYTRMVGYFETMKSWQSAITEHEVILSAISAKDALAARAAMHAHMDKSHARFSASWRKAKTS